MPCAVAHNNKGLVEEKLGYQKDAITSFDKADLLAETKPSKIQDEKSGKKVNGNQIDLDTSFSKLDKTTESKSRNHYWTVFRNLFFKRETQTEFVNFIRSKFRGF